MLLVGNTALRSPEAVDVLRRLLLLLLLPFLSSLQAAKDTKHRMGPAADRVTVLHFNDVYNVAAREEPEPVGGAARFAAAFRSYDHLSPIVLFSGDVFAPSVSEYYVQQNSDICATPYYTTTVDV